MATRCGIPSYIHVCTCVCMFVPSGSRFTLVPLHSPPGSAVFDALCILPLALHVLSYGELDLFAQSGRAYYIRAWRTMRILKFLRYFPAIRSLIVVRIRCIMLCRVSLVCLVSIAPTAVCRGLYPLSRTSARSSVCAPPPGYVTFGWRSSKPGGQIPNRGTHHLASGVLPHCRGTISGSFP